MASALPDDVLHLICGQLGVQRDFNTLYNCAVSSRQLALAALSTIYRIHDVAPVISGGAEEVGRLPIQRANFANTAAEQERMTRKWALLWRSIILSSLDQTLFPYCRYIRALNLRDLANLFEESKFRGDIEKTFFGGALRTYNIRKESPYGRAGPKGLRPQILDVVKAVAAIGEVVTQKTPVLEELSGNILPHALPTWISRAPRLQTLILWRGDALIQDAEVAICDNCPQFKSLTIYEWTGEKIPKEKVDSHLAKFFNGLRPQTLQYFHIISYSSIETQSFLALNCHSRSLTELKLSNLTDSAIKALPMLKGCTALKVLELEDLQGSIELKTSHNDISLEVTAWLCECKCLESVELKKFVDGPAILTSLLVENNIHLKKLSLDGYAMRENQAFHSALVHQKKLQSLWLRGDGDDVTRDDIDVLVDSLCQLTDLRDLELKDVSDYFRDNDLCKLAKNLPELEEFWTSGWNVTDAIWEDFSRLHNLRSLMIYAMSSFTADGILGFISELGPGNKGLYLSIMNADVDFNLSEEVQGVIRDTMITNLDGRFDFTCFRDPDVSDFEGESD